MQRESFAHEEIAAHLNADFISIKVDREERPDIDQLYMAACQNMTGSGGWPLTVLLDSEQRPFFAGTYFTPKQLSSILGQALVAWRQRRVELARFSDRLINLLRQQESNIKAIPDTALTHRAYSILEKRFDTRYGGFGPAPKFPTPQLLLFLLRYAEYEDQPRALQMATHTLHCIAKGGIQDQIGFGFSRYATDRSWLIPHFEKMLYDNALLSLAYAEASQAIRETSPAEAQKLAKVAKRTNTYLLQDMQSPEGGFYTAEDADSEGEEGRFYLWTPKEISSVLGPEDGTEAARLLHINDLGNFEGRCVPNLVGYMLTPDEERFLEEQLPKLRQARDKRPRPLRDEKILVSLNGLAIAALARSAQYFAEPDYYQAAAQAARFILKELDSSDGRLYSCYYSGVKRFPANAEDYAFLTWGLLELYAAKPEWFWLAKAKRCCQILLQDFYDERQGGFFLSSKNAETLIVRQKAANDGAYPSANSVAADCLQRLGTLLGDESLLNKAQETRTAFGMAALENPTAYIWLLSTLLTACETDRLLIVAPRAPQYEAMLHLARRIAPRLPIVCWSEDQPLEPALAELFKAYHPRDGRATAYLCRNNACLAPLTDEWELEKLLRG